MLDYISHINESVSVSFADFVRARENMGKKVVKMQTGDPDFPTHAKVVDAAKQALLQGQTKYCDSRGLAPLRTALANKLSKENRIQVSYTENILITHGAVHGISIAIRALLNPGDECIILEPFWRSYHSTVLLSGGVPVIIQTSQENGFTLEADKVLSRITSRTRLIIINTPNNPSGSVYKKAELVKLANGATEKGIYIISDEVYESILFDKNKHYSIASDPSVFSHVVTAFSFSKSHAMTGWRIGYLVASKELIDQMLKLSQFSITSLAPFTQLAALAALTEQEALAYPEQMRQEYERRRNVIRNKITGTWLEKESTNPGGTFYILINASRFRMPSLSLAKKIVDDTDVSFTPGIAFGDGMDNYLRLCFAASSEDITKAIDALLSFEKNF